MKFTIENGKATISLVDLLEEFGEEGRESLIGFLAIEGHVIEAVVDLLIDGQTKEGAWISHAAGDAVEKARVRLLAAADKVMHEAAKAMLRDRQCAQASEKVYSTWAFRLYNAWPRNCGWAPHGPEKIDRYPWPDGAEVDEAIAQKLAEIRAKVGESSNAHGFVAVPTDPELCRCGEPRAHRTHARPTESADPESESLGLGVEG